MQESRSESAPEEPSPLRILYLEDNSADIELCLRQLAAAGMRVDAEIVQTSEQFTRTLDFNRYDLILADYRLPGWTGLDALECLRTRGLDIPFILVTGNLGEETAVECARKGAWDCVVKDRLARLPLTIARALEERALREQRARAEEALRASERRYRLLVERSVAGVFQSSPKGRLLDCNRALACMLGYRSPEELLARTTRELYWDPSDRERLRKAILRKGSITNQEVRLRRSDGRPVWVLLNATMIDDGPAIEGTVIDITERKRAQELEISEQAARARARAEARFRELLETAPDAILETDAGGRIVLLNAAAEKMFGYGRKELLGLTVEVLIPERFREDHVAWRSAYQEAPAQRMVRQGRDIWARRSDGTEFPVEVSLSPVRSEGGDLVTCIVRDVTHRKRAEEALLESSRRVASILESITDGFFALDRDWRFTYLNGKAEQLISRKREDLLGRNIWEEFPELVGSVFYDEYHKAAAERTPVEFAAHYPTLKIWAEFHVYPSESGLSVYFQDITARKHLEEQFRQSQKLEALGRLAGGVAHDFNNLLTIIGGYGQMLLDSMDAGNPARRDMDAIVEAANRASALTRQLLTFSRRQFVQPKVLQANRLVARMNKMLGRLIGEDIELRLVLRPEVGRIQADPSQLEQVIMNLVVNARDAMPTGGRITIETEQVEIGSSSAAPVQLPPGGYVVVSVADTGTGMDAETRSRIFEPFFTTKSRGKGTGLGLSTVYGIVKQCRGEIVVDTEPGKGCAFRIFLPRVEKGARRGRSGGKGTRPGGGTETILLVEDEAELRKLAREMLVRQGYRVIEAGDGRSAIEQWRRHGEAVDLLLTDVIMPQMSGRELAERLAALRPGLKVLYMSGYTEEVIARHGVLGSQIELLQKPFTRQSLAVKVRKVLDKCER